MAEDESTERVHVDYDEFFNFPDDPKTTSSAKCKVCFKTYKYSKNSKGNLLKHLQKAHLRQLEAHKDKKKRQLENQSTFEKDGTYVARQPEFKNQEVVLNSIVRNLCGQGGLPITIVERSWFRRFMKDVEPRFNHVSRNAVGSRIKELSEQAKSRLLNEISVISRFGLKPTVTVDFWSGRDNRSFMGCTVHYVHEKQLKHSMLFFKEVPPPHTSENIKIHFEDEIDRCEVHCFQVVTDNAANMKRAFQVLRDESDDDTIDGATQETTRIWQPEYSDELECLEEWTVHELRYDGWIGCAAHQLQLVVHDGYRELTLYRRVQAAFNKAKAICSLSRKSSHFAYALSTRIPVANDTRWSSHFRLHEHLLDNMEDINRALASEKINRPALIFSRSDKEHLSLVVDVMQYFAQATDILQGEKMSTCNRVIPVIDSLENALLCIDRSNPAINALCERLVTSLQQRFSYLLESSIHQVATLLDPSIKLSFTDHSDERKFFVFSSTEVKSKARELLPVEQTLTSSLAPVEASESPKSKKPKLMDFSTVTINTASTASCGELQHYLDQPVVNVKAVEYWAERKITPLSTLALQLLSVPSSSAPVERLFSKAGFLLSQRRTRLSSMKLEQLLFLKS